MLDAFTAKEMVCFHTRVLDEHLPKAFDVLADMALDPQFAEEDIERERSVVLEEIRMSRTILKIWSMRFSRRISGRSPPWEADFWHTGNRCIVHALRAARVPFLLCAETDGDYRCREYFASAVLDLVTERFHIRAPDGAATETTPPQIILAPRRTGAGPHLHRRSVFLDDRPPPIAVSLLNSVLGGGMSSRLFQNIREQQGLAYSIFSDRTWYRDTGALSVYAGTSLQTGVSS